MFKTTKKDFIASLDRLRREEGEYGCKLDEQLEEDRRFYEDIYRAKLRGTNTSSHERAFILFHLVGIRGRRDFFDFFKNYVVQDNDPMPMFNTLIRLTYAYSYNEIGKTFKKRMDEIYGEDKVKNELDKMHNEYISLDDD